MPRWCQSSRLRHPLDLAPRGCKSQRCKSPQRIPGRAGQAPCVTTQSRSDSSKIRSAPLAPSVSIVLRKSNSILARIPPLDSCQFGWNNTSVFQIKVVHVKTQMASASREPPQTARRARLALGLVVPPVSEHNPQLFARAARLVQHRQRWAVAEGHRGLARPASSRPPLPGNEESASP